MGQSTNGIIAYGYDLGGDEGWKLQGLGEYGELPDLPWYNPENEDDEGFQSAAETRLLAEIAEFTEEYPYDEPKETRSAYFERERQAKARIGIKFDTYCSGDYPMFLLATKVITVRRGSVEEIDMTELAVAPEMNGWDEKLQAAVTALGITPIQDKPKWLLASYWG